MQPNEQARRPGGGRGYRQQNQQQARTQQPQQQQENPQQYENPVVSERLDSLIYGYLRRSGHNEAANALEQESPFLRNSLTRFENNRPVVVLNDRLYDHTLEDIVSIFHRDGRFGVNQSMIELGEDLRRLTTRFITITNNAAAAVTGRSSMHQDLYGRPSYSRNQQPQNYAVAPAPQALAQMELRRVNQMAEIRYREEQRQQPRTQHVSIASTSVPQPPPAPTPTQQCHNQDQLPPVHFQQEHIPQGITHYEEEEVPRSSRRKLSHPQNVNAKVENALNPLVGFINERPLNVPFDDMMDIDFNAGFNLDGIRPEFIRALDYDPVQEMMQQEHHDDQREFNEVFEEVLDGRDQQHFADPSLVVHEEVVVETEEEVVVEDNFLIAEVKPTIMYPGAPEPLLSPLPKDMEFRKHAGSTIHQQQASYVPGQPASKHDYVIPKKSKDMPSTSDGKREDKERRDRKPEEKSTRSSNSPQRNRSDDQKRREKERDREKSTNRERVREKRRDERKDTHVSHVTPSTRESTSKHRRSNEAHHSTVVQSDRESTSSSSSRVTAPDKRDAEKEKKRKEKEQRKSFESAEIEKDQRAKEKEKLKSSSVPSSSGAYNKEANDFLNKLRKSHAAGSTKSTDLNRLNKSMESPSSSKRKADETVKREFKIPKKNSTSTPSGRSESRSSHGRSVSKDPLTSAASSSKAEKSNSKKSPLQDMSHGDERSDSTHFINPIGHLARLSSILLNCDTTYKQFQAGLQQKESKPHKATPTPSPSSSAKSDESSNAGTSSNATMHTHPKGRSFAPMKGALLSKNPKMTPSTSDSSSEAGSTPKDNSDDESSENASQKSRSASPAPPKKSRVEPFDITKTNKLMDKLHGPR